MNRQWFFSGVNSLLVSGRVTLKCCQEHPQESHPVEHNKYHGSTRTWTGYTRPCPLIDSHDVTFSRLPRFPDFLCSKLLAMAKGSPLPSDKGDSFFRCRNCATPRKSKIDTKKYSIPKWWFGKCISFQTWLFSISMLNFRGVYLPVLSRMFKAKSWL